MYKIIGVVLCIFMSVNFVTWAERTKVDETQTKSVPCGTSITINGPIFLHQGALAPTCEAAEKKLMEKIKELGWSVAYFYCLHCPLENPLGCESDFSPASAIPPTQITKPKCVQSETDCVCVSYATSEGGKFSCSTCRKPAFDPSVKDYGCILD